MDFDNQENETLQEWEWQRRLVNLRRKRELESLGIDYEKYRASKLVYCGQEFRSILEATWAAFFDFVGFDWEYEPNNKHFRDWKPDFVIWKEEQPVYCEVKPLYFGIFPNELAQKIVTSEVFPQSQVKVAMLGLAAPLWVRHPKGGYMPSLGYISLAKNQNSRIWLPFSVGNTIKINALWKQAIAEGGSLTIAVIEKCKRRKRRTPGLKKINLLDGFYTPVEDFGYEENQQF